MLTYQREIAIVAKKWVVSIAKHRFEKLSQILNHSPYLFTGWAGYLDLWGQRSRLRGLTPAWTARQAASQTCRGTGCQCCSCLPASQWLHQVWASRWVLMVRCLRPHQRGWHRTVRSPSDPADHHHKRSWCFRSRAACCSSLRGYQRWTGPVPWCAQCRWHELSHLHSWPFRRRLRTDSHFHSQHRELWHLVEVCSPTTPCRSSARAAVKWLHCNR